MSIREKPSSVIPHRHLLVVLLVCMHLLPAGISSASTSASKTLLEKFDGIYFYVKVVLIRTGCYFGRVSDLLPPIVMYRSARQQSSSIYSIGIEYVSLLE